MSTDIPDPVMDSILDLLAQGQKIQAVKLYKDSTQSSLAEAKAAIHALELRIGKEDPLGRPVSLDGDIEKLIYGRQKIAAIKLYMQRENVSLIDGKIAVERHTTRLEAEHPDRFSAIKSTGCMSAVAFVVIILSVSWLATTNSLIE